MQQIALGSRPQDAYRKQAALTASPMELIIMLYDGLKKNIALGRRGIENHDVKKAHTHFMKAQAIVTELMNSLDMNYEISNELAQIYEFVLYTLENANIKKDAAELTPLLEIVESLRGAWQEVGEANKGNLHLNTGESEA